MSDKPNLDVAKVERVRALHDLVTLALREADLLDLIMPGIHLDSARESLAAILSPKPEMPD